MTAYLAREQRIWRFWIGLVVLLTIGASVLLWQPPGGRPSVRLDEPTIEVPAPTASAVPLADAPSSGTVWVNTRSHIYHYPSSRWYGATSEGKYTSEREAAQEGDRAALNEQRPADFSEPVRQ